MFSMNSTSTTTSADDRSNANDDDDGTKNPDLCSSRRCIFNDVDMEAWKKSPLKQDLLRVVGAMGKSCASASSNFHYDPEKPLVGLSPAMASLHGSLTQMLKWLEDDIPPLQEQQQSKATAASEEVQVPLTFRFGNPAFKAWHARLKHRSLAIIREMYRVHQLSICGDSKSTISLKEASQRGFLAAAAQAEPAYSNTETKSEEEPPFVHELASYLHDAFGHPIRLDYGTGHESSFMVVLYSTCKLGWMDETATNSHPPTMDKLKASTISIFHAYLKVTRQLQMEYRLEPAGSHGVWGLDDYHCLPFYFGACQCQAPVSPYDAVIDEMPHPRDITEETIRKRYSNALLYFGCMDYICTLKRGAPLFECSPMLYDVSQTCPTWSKVASGLIKLYEGEVLNKRQVVQHFTFGNQLFVATWQPSQASPPEPPTTTFRSTAGIPVAPMIRAPWTASGAAVGGGELPMSRAPWANTSRGGADETNSTSGAGTTTGTGTDFSTGADHPKMPPPIKAPWAK